MSTSISTTDLEKIHALLVNASGSSSSQIQKSVFAQLSLAEQNPMFYIGLVTIACNCEVQIKVRQLAFLTIKSALQRNQDVIQFSPQQLDYIRAYVIKSSIEQQSSSKQILALSKSKKILVSVLIQWKKDLDFHVLAYLLQKVASQNKRESSQGLETLKLTFEDLKFQTENMSCLQKPQFAQFLQSYFKLFGEKMSSNLQSKEIALMIECTNLLLKYLHHMSQSSAHILQQYLTKYLLPILHLKTVEAPVLEAVLEGVTQIIEINPQTIMSMNAALGTIIQFRQCNSEEATKKWLGLIYDIVSKDNEDQKTKPYLSTLIPEVLKNLIFTKEDQDNVIMEMAEENNPYQYQQLDEENDEADQQENQFGQSQFSRYTKRRLAVLVIEELLNWYSDQVWAICQPYITHMIKGSDMLQRQCGVLLLGIIFGKIEDHIQYLQTAIPSVSAQINDSSLPQIIRCTSLWTLSKLAYLIVRDSVMSALVQHQILKVLSDSDGQIRDAAYHSLDEFIRCIDQLPANITQIVNCVGRGIKSTQGKPLYSVLKICSTLYERHSDNIPHQITSTILKELCAKWNANSKIQSIMSPILECLVTISSSNSEVFNEFSLQIFKEAFKILNQEHQKTLVLRAIDLVSSIVSTNNPQIIPIVEQSQQLHTRIFTLLNSTQNEIRNFTLGLLGDICKSTPIPLFAEKYIQTIGQNFNSSSLPSCSNALTCLTDLIVVHPWLAQKYAKSVVVLALQRMKINNLMPVFGFNFARVYSRLAKLCSHQLTVEEVIDGIKYSGMFLKSHETQKLTDDAYRGLFQIVELRPNQAAKSFEFVVESFICYPCDDKELSHKFTGLLKMYRNSLNPDQWKMFLAKPLFLPAVAKRIDALSC